MVVHEEKKREGFERGRGEREMQSYHVQNIVIEKYLLKLDEIIFNRNNQYIINITTIRCAYSQNIYTYQIQKVLHFAWNILWLNFTDYNGIYDV